MDTKPKLSQRELLKWIAERLQAGRLKLIPDLDDAGEVVAVHAIRGEDLPAKGSGADPRRTKPL
jgi:hypothetical protein